MPNPENPDEAECRWCHDTGITPGTYDPCRHCRPYDAARVDQERAATNPNIGPRTTSPAISDPSEEDVMPQTPDPRVPTDERPYGWLDFEPEPDTDAGGNGDPDKYFLFIGIWEGGSYSGEIACIVHRTCNGTYPLNGAVAEQKRLIAQHIVNVLNDNPINFDNIVEAIDFKEVAARTAHEYDRKRAEYQKRADYRVGEITLDGQVTVTAQYHATQRWNGWLVPALDAWSVVKVIDAITEIQDQDDVHDTFEWDGDVLVITTHYGDAEGTDAGGERLEPDEDGLYALGAFSWVWSAVHKNEEN